MLTSSPTTWILAWPCGGQLERGTPTCGPAHLNQNLRAFRFCIARVGIVVIALGGIVDSTRGGDVVAVVIVRSGLSRSWHP
jgi:hypothetical protein